MTTQCTVQDCRNPVISHGLCDMHRKRLSRHGHLRKTRPDDWGKREKHPLYATWCWMRRMRAKHSIIKEWNDFWKFVNDVGERPSPQHQLRRIDQSSGYSKSNCKWIETIPDQDRAEYARQWRKNNPDKVKNTELRKMFGISLEDYNNLVEQQDGKCAICNGIDKNQALSVDHCHKTGKVRGLLCKNCNRGLGLFKDNTILLKRASNYLGA